MICRDVRRAILRTTLASEGRGPLSEHLASCPGCAREAREGARLVADLAALRSEIPFEIDVADRVRARIAALPARRRDGSVARATWLLSAALAAAVALAAVGVAHGTLFDAALRTLLQAAPEIVRALGEALRPAGSMLAALGAVTLRLWQIALPILERAGRLLPSFEGSLLAALVLMTLTTLLGVREIRRAPPAHGKGP